MKRPITEIVICLLTSLLCIGCKDNKADNARLREENAALKKDLEESKCKLEVSDRSGRQNKNTGRSSNLPPTAERFQDVSEKEGSLIIFNKYECDGVPIGDKLGSKKLLIGFCHAYEWEIEQVKAQAFSLSLEFFSTYENQKNIVECGTLLEYREVVSFHNSIKTMLKYLKDESTLPSGSTMRFRACSGLVLEIMEHCENWSSKPNLIVGIEIDSITIDINIDQLEDLNEVIGDIISRIDQLRNKKY